MAANKLRAVVYKSADGWRWHLRKGRNIIAQSSESYVKRSACIRGLEIVTRLWFIPDTGVSPQGLHDNNSVLRVPVEVIK